VKNDIYAPVSPTGEITMEYNVRNSDEHFANDGKPKRILALDGGGLRGILTLSYLAKIEALLKERHRGSANFRLSHYFDLIAGTSTGAIIAAALARGMSVAEITEKYLDLGERVFQKSWLRKGVVRALYDEAGLIRQLKKVYDPHTTLGDPSVQTGLLIIAKRLDTGSPWLISNNPRGKYYGARPNGVIANSDYPLWQAVRASTAAPRYFDPEKINISRGRSGEKAVRGEFVDGGVSPYNNPALPALMYATLSGYRVGWPTGADKLLVVSVGTGSRDADVAPASSAATNALKSLVSLMDDCADLMETLLQWMSASPTARVIDRELGDLSGDLIAPAPLMTYLRYNVPLTGDSLASLGMSLPAEQIESLSAMDDPKNMKTLQEVGSFAAVRQIRPGDFPEGFDLPA
jgi:predicted acylesterase/phospholipase RssA